MQESSDDEEDEREKFVEATLSKVLDNIDQNLKRVPDLVPKYCQIPFDDEENIQENTTSIILDLKGKAPTEFEPGEPSKEQENLEKDNIANETYEDSDIFMREFEKDTQSREIEQFKLQNEHINQINDSLLKKNKILKQDLQEINKNYLYLAQVEE